MLQLSAPSKTFLVGEYIALHGAPTLILNTLPRFQLTVIPGTSSLADWARYPGVQRLLSQHPSILNRYQFSFADPHLEQGGLGASSAAFALIYAALQWLQTGQLDLHWQTWLAAYQACHATKTGYSPSGADFIGQLHGQMTYFHHQQQHLTTLDWPFPDLQFCILRTGVKIPTDQHLQRPLQFPLDELKTIAEQAYQGVRRAEKTRLISAINAYSACLSRCQLVHPNTQDLLAEVAAIPGVKAAKGCGALGADTLLILFEKNQEQELSRWLRHNHKVCVANTAHLSDGLRVKET